MQPLLLYKLNCSLHCCINLIVAFILVLYKSLQLSLVQKEPLKSDLGALTLLVNQPTLYQATLKVFTYNVDSTTDVKELNTKAVKFRSRRHIPTSRVWGCFFGWVCGTNTTMVIALTVIVYAIQRRLWSKLLWYRA